MKANFSYNFDQKSNLKGQIPAHKWTKKLLPAATKNNQPNLFYGSLMDLLDSSDPLIALADTIEWEEFEDSFAPLYSDEGRPAKPIRLMV